METFQGALHLPSPCTPRRAGSLVKLASSASHKQEHTISCKWFSYFLAGREGVRALTTKSPPRLWGVFPFKGLLHPPPSQGLHSQGCTAPGVPLYFLPASPGLSPTPRAALPSRGGPKEAVQGPGRLSFLQLPSHGPGETPEIKGSAADQVSSLVHRPRLIKLLTHKEIKPGPLPAVG